jgi:pimeloyl-ACP methyl ester carboxylesterase
VASGLAWIYLWAGVRAGSVPGDAQDRLVRFAVPLGTPPEQLTAAADRLAALTAVTDIPDLLAVHGARDAGFHPRKGVPVDIRQELAAGYQPRDDNWAVLREHQPQVRRDLLSVGGADVEVFSAGAGPVLLLMHPFNIGAGVFAAQFAELAQRFRLVCVQHPGVGRSTIGDELSLEAIVRTDRVALRELGCTDPVHLVGSSFGSLTALRFVLDHPADVASLMLIGGSTTLGDRATEVNRLDVVAERDLTSAVEGSRSRRLRRDRDRHRDHLLRCESMDPYTGLRYLDVFADPPRFESRLGEVRVPTRIVHGRFDTVVPIQQARLLTSGITQARLEEVRDAGHFPMVTCPTALNALISGFLIDQARPGSAPVSPTPVAVAGRGV